MAKYSFSCASIGQNCGFEIINASSEEELLQQITVHAKSSHGINNPPKDLVDKIKANIKKSGKYSFSCASIGQNCGFEIKNAGNEDELMQQIALHAKMSHGINNPPKDLVDKIKANIKTE
ncbi:MAG: DUF1059 domain-containing protein [Sulfolobaceae archaeon]|nr:DUF1059 domain-containing protein [Sulfolobaceae archaeon]